MILILFDIDGTLISTGGAGMRAFRRAVKSVLDLDLDSGVIHPDGKTDPLILKEVLEHFRLTGNRAENTQREVFSKYLEYLESEMLMAEKNQKNRILPGVEGLLEILSRQMDLCVGLATGNLEAGARIKLEASGLYRFFQFGGFGSDSENRTELTRIGIRRGTHRVFPNPVDGVFVVGDTPFDVIHGRAAGARVIAVAGGSYSMEELRQCNPDLLLPDLTSAGPILSFIRERSRFRKSLQA